MKKFLTIALILLTFNIAAFAAGTWVSQTSPTGEALYGVYMTSQITACAVGDNNTIIKTDDIGQSWAIRVSAIPGDNLKAVHFPSSSVGYAAGTTNVVLKTTNGGDTWAPTLDPTLVSGPYDIFFTSNNVGYACGDHISLGPLQKTIDGNSWAGSSGGLPANETFYGIFFIDSNNGWIVGSNGKIYNTINAGGNWSAQSSGISIDFLKDIFFIDSSTGWVAGDNGIVLKTTNAGTTWNPSDTGISGSPNLNAIHFVNSDKGWVVGDGGVIYATIDGGANWTAETSGTSSDILDVHFYDEKHGFVVGDAGNILNYGLEPIFNVSPSSTYAGNALNIALTAASDTIFYPGTTVTVSKTGGSGFGYTFNLVSDTLIDIPADLDDSVTTGDWTITVTGPNSRTASGTFTVNPLPDISSISPSTGIQGTTDLTLTIFGSGFQNGVTFDFGSNIAVTSTTFDSANQATVVVDIGSGAATGPRNVTPTNPDGGTSTSTDIFTVSAPVTPPGLTSVSPYNVPQGITQDMEINGSNLQSGAVVSIANNSITINSTDYSNVPNKITINVSVASNANVGPRTVIVTNPDQGSASLTNAFYVQTPAAINPTIDSLDRQIYIGIVKKTFALNGSNFQSGATLSFNPSTGIIVDDLQFISSTQLRGIISVDSSLQPGTVTLRVMNPDGGFDDFSFNLEAPEMGKTILCLPNPVNARTAKSVNFQFEMSRDGLVTLPIFDKTGRKLAELVHNGTVGKNTVTWNLRTFANEIPANQILLINALYNNKRIAKGKLVIVSH